MTDHPAHAVCDEIYRARLEQPLNGCSDVRDDTYVSHELTDAAIAYCFSASERRKYGYGWWPLSWSSARFKPKSPRRDLIRAAALIVAEIERMDRAERAKQS